MFVVVERSAANEEAGRRRRGRAAGTSSWVSLASVSDSGVLRTAGVTGGEGKDISGFSVHCSVANFSNCS